MGRHRILAGTSAVLLAFARSAFPSTPEEIARLIEKMKASYDTESWSAVDALGKVGEPAVGPLLGVLRDRSLSNLQNVKSPARYQAAFALARVGPPAKDAVPTLLSLLNDRTEDEGVRWAAAGALGDIGASVDLVVPALLAVVEGNRSSLSAYSLGALAKLAKNVPASHSYLRRDISILRAAQQGWDGGPAFAALFRILDPPSLERGAAENEVLELLFRRELGSRSAVWCVIGAPEEILKRIDPLVVSCSEWLERRRSPSLFRKDRKSETSGDLLRVDYVDFISEGRVAARTSACGDSVPCGTTEYILERRLEGWVIASSGHPPVM